MIFKLGMPGDRGSYPCPPHFWTSFAYQGGEQNTKVQNCDHSLMERSSINCKVVIFFSDRSQSETPNTIESLWYIERDKCTK